MRFKMLRKNQTIFNKVNGKSYLVLDNNQAIMLETDKDGELQTVAGTEITITEKNALAFRLVSDPNTEPVPDIASYTLKDGILMQNDAPVTNQGQLYIECILGAITGFLILQARYTDQEKDRGYLFTYNVKEDRFALCKGCDYSLPVCNIVPLSTKEDSIVLYGYEVAKEKVKNDDGEEECIDVLKASYLISFCSMHKGRKLATTVKSLDSLLLADCREVIESDHHFVVEVIGTTNPASEKHELKTAPDGQYKYLLYSQNLSECIPFETTKEVKSVAFSHLDVGFFVVQIEDSVLILDDLEPKIFSGVSVPDGYVHLIDITHKDHETRLSFANADYDIKTIVSKNTEDRGFIVTVE